MILSLLKSSRNGLAAFVGQAANNIALSLDNNLPGTVKVYGTAPKLVDEAEDRFKFSRALDEIKIAQPEWKNAKNRVEAEFFCDYRVGYPCLVRPSYVLSGAAMNVAHCVENLGRFLEYAMGIATKDKPIVVSKFIEDAKKIDVDVVGIEGKVLRMAISEHVENAEIHSGDVTLVTPPLDMNEETLEKDIVKAIASRFKATGPFNLHLIAKDNELFVIEYHLRFKRTLQQHKVGVKVPQSSFSRLAGADVVMGVEMLSTGKVICFGPSRQRLLPTPSMHLRSYSSSSGERENGETPPIVRLGFTSLLIGLAAMVVGAIMAFVGTLFATYARVGDVKSEQSGMKFELKKEIGTLSTSLSTLSTRIDSLQKAINGKYSK